MNDLLLLFFCFFVFLLVGFWLLCSKTHWFCFLLVLCVQYADPVSDLLDKWGAFRCRLFRESCVFHRGNYVKDLSRLGRDLNKVIIVDNSPASYIFHPDNAVCLCLSIYTVYSVLFLCAFVLVMVQHSLTPPHAVT